MGMRLLKWAAGFLAVVLFVPVLLWYGDVMTLQDWSRLIDHRPAYTPEVVVPRPESQRPFRPPAANALSVKDFGAKGDGLADDTEAIQAAIQATPDKGGTVFVPPGTYLVDALQSIRLKSGVTLHMTPETVLRARANRSKFYAVLTIENVHNVQVISGVIQGDRYRHIGGEGEWGMGIQITAARDVTIQGTMVQECWGDGFYIGTETFTGPDTWKKILDVPERIQLVDVRAHNNRRQGISVIAGRNVEIIRAELTATNGTDPAAGIDLEPNQPTDVMDKIRIVDLVTRGNQGDGILINLSHLKEGKVPVDIEIVNHRDDGSERGLHVSSHDAVVAGEVRIERPEWINSRKSGMTVRNHDHRSFAIVVRQPRIVDANRDGARGAQVDGAAISIFHNKGAVQGRTDAIGHVTILNPTILDNGKGPRMVAPFHIWDDVPGQTIRDVRIVDPVLVGVMKDVPLYENVKPFVEYSAGRP